MPIFFLEIGVDLLRNNVFYDILVKNTNWEKNSMEDIMKEIKQFNEERDWGQFHTPENLAKSISIEANELLECFQWDAENYNKEDVCEELADVFEALKNPFA